MAELNRKPKNTVKERQQVANWYEVEQIPDAAIRASLHCQRLNCRWDSTLRYEWIRLIWFVVGTLVLAAIMVGVVFEVSLIDVVFLAAASLRLTAWVIAEQRAQSAAKNRMINLHRFLSNSEANDVTPCDVRLAQAAIFDHRRVTPTVPDWFYIIRRKAHERKLT